jgi:hypothetical protein
MRRSGQHRWLCKQHRFRLDEECFAYSECNQLTPFVTAGKAVFEAEYNLSPSQFCAQANALGFMALTAGQLGWSEGCGEL